MFTDPEILRTNLASVILQMTSLRLGDIARFPFVEPPDKRNVTDGVQLLEELGAVSTASARDERARLTKVGQRLARLPIDPRLGRMILEAERLGVVRDVLVIAAALSLQDPRERPVEQRPQADQQHARFTDKTSDFLTWLNLWRYLREQQRELSGSAFRRMCKREYLNYLRVREWQDFESQLRQVCKEMAIELGQPGRRARTPTASTRRCWPGCSATSGCSRSGTARKARGPREYLGARNSRFAIFPGSALKGANPTYLMAGELVETGRLWARQNAAIKPEWAEQIGAHLVKRTYSEPHWSKKRAAVMAYERVTLYGVPLVADRLVQYGRIDQALSREMFIRHALVYGEWSTDGSTVLPREPAAAGGGRGARAPRPAPRPRRRRAHPVRLLRRAHRRRGRQRRALRPVVEAGPAAASPTCSPSTRRCSPTTRSRRCARPTTRRAGRPRG